MHAYIRAYRYWYIDMCVCVHMDLWQRSNILDTSEKAFSYFDVSDYFFFLSFIQLFFSSFGYINQSQWDYTFMAMSQTNFQHITMILQEKTKLVTFGQKNPYKYLQSGQPEIIYESCIPNDSPYWISNGHNLFTEQGRPVQKLLVCFI